MPNPTTQRGQRKPGQKQRRQKKKNKAKQNQITAEMEKENTLRYLQDAFKDTLDAVLIHSVLQDYNYDVEKTLETLFVLAESTAAETINKKVPSFKDITAGLRKIKDTEDDSSSSDEEEGERAEEDLALVNLNRASNGRDETNPSQNSYDSLLDLPLLPKPSPDNYSQPNVFKLSELQQEGKESGARHYNLESYLEAENSRKMQSENSVHESRYGTGAQIDALLAESKLWNYYGENGSLYQNQPQMISPLYGYHGSVSHTAESNHRAGNGGMMKSYFPDPSPSQGQMFRTGEADSSGYNIGNTGNSSHTGGLGQIPGQTRTTENGLYRQNNPIHRASHQNVQSKVNSSGLSQKQTNSLANKQRNQLESSTWNVSAPTWPNKKTNIVPVSTQSAVSKSDHVTPLPKGKVLCLMRGLPGSGKSTLAKKLLPSNKSGVILSTDDYFRQPDGKYQFNPKELDTAHRQTQQHAKDAMRNGLTPVIIDNTNTQRWEMKPYVVYAQQFNYTVELREPNTPWKSNVSELSRRNTHGVPKEKISQMLDRFEKVDTVESILKVPDKFPDASARDKMDPRTRAKSPSPGRGKNLTHPKPKGVTLERVQTSSVSHTRSRDETVKSNRSGSTPGKQNSIPPKTPGRLGSSRRVQETLIHAQQVPSQNALPPEDTSSQERKRSRASSTDSNLSEIQQVVTSIPLASCLRGSMDSFQAKLKDINDISGLLDENKSEDKSDETVQCTGKLEGKGKKEMKSETTDTAKKMGASQNDKKAPQDRSTEMENEREVEGSSSPEPSMATPYKESSVDPPHFHNDNNSETISDRGQFATRAIDSYHERKVGSLKRDDVSIVSGDENGGEEFDKYLSPSKPDDVSSKSALEFGTTSPRKTCKMGGLSNSGDETLTEFTDTRPNSDLSEVNGISTFSEHSRGASISEGLKPKAVRPKELGSAGLHSSKFSHHGSTGTNESHFVPVEKPESQQKQFEVVKGLTPSGAKVANEVMERHKIGLSNFSSSRDNSRNEGVNVNTVTCEMQDKVTIPNWDATGAKPKMKRALSESHILKSDNPALKLPSSPLVGYASSQSHSTVPQIKKKHRRVATPLGRRILAPSFSLSVLSSVQEPHVLFGETKSAKESKWAKDHSSGEGKGEVFSNFESKGEEDTLKGRTEGDCAKRLPLEQLSEEKVEERTEQIDEAVFPRTHVSDILHKGDEQKSQVVLDASNDSSEVSEGKPPTEMSEGDTNGSKDTAPAVKRKTARHSKTKSPPLLDEETRQKALTRNWSSGAITREVLMPHVALASHLSVPSFPEMQHHGSQTDASHFNLLEKVNRMSESEAVLEGHLMVRRVTPGEWRGIGENAAASSNSKMQGIPHRRKIDKSSMTDDESKIHNPEGGLDLLGSIFPHIEKEHIQEVLQRCKGNAQWASEILVESNHLSTERKKREQKREKETLSQSDQGQRVQTTSSQTSRADFLFLKVTNDNTMVPEEAPNVRVLTVGEWQEVCSGRVGGDDGVGFTHVGTLVNFEELMPNFDRDLSMLLQTYLHVPFLEVCERLEKNKGDVAKTEMELQRKYHDKADESPHSAAVRDITSQDYAATITTQHIHLSTGAKTGVRGIASERKEDQGNIPKMKGSSFSATPGEPHLQKDIRTNKKSQVRQSAATSRLIDGEQASLSDQESSYGRRGREMSERSEKDCKRSRRGRARSLPRKKPDPLVGQTSSTLSGSKRQKFETNSDHGSKSSSSQVSVEPRNDHALGHQGATKVKRPGTEGMFKHLPDRYNLQNLTKRMETPNYGTSSANQQVGVGAMGYDPRLNQEGVDKTNQDMKGTSGSKDKQGEEPGAEGYENQERGQEAVAEASPSELLDDVGKGVPKRFHQGMVFQLDMAFALQLQEIFGSVGYCIDTDVLSEDDLAIPVDLQLAKAIHTAWCVSFKQKFDREEAQLLEMMKQDEALAKKLQKEEEKMKMEEEQKRREEQYRGKNAGQQTVAYHGLPESSVRGHSSIKGSTLSGSSGPPHYALSADNFRDIMDEHVAEEIGKEMQREDALSTEKANSMAVRIRRKQLLEKYPGVSPSRLEDIFMKNNFDIDPSIKEIDAVLVTSEGSRNVYSEEALKRMEDEQLKQALEESVESQYKQVTSRRSPKTPRRMLPQPEDNEPDLKKQNKFQSLEHPDYHDYRAEANLHYQQRQEYFKKASDAFRNGQSQLAAYYSEEGHKHTALLQEANQRASEAILADKNKEQDDDTLDLHGLHVDEALEALETKMVEKSMRLKYSSPYIRPSPFLFIITGKGNHSKYGVAKIKPAVINFLKTKGYRFETMNQGMLKVKLSC